MSEIQAQPGFSGRPTLTGLPARPIVNPHKPRRARLLLLLLPYAGLCFPGLYARTSPVLFGFPFFYWYQFAWVILTSCLLGYVYFGLRQPEQKA